MPAIAIYQHDIPRQTYSPVGTENIAGMAHSYGSLFALESQLRVQKCFAYPCFLACFY